MKNIKKNKKIFLIIMLCFCFFIQVSGILASSNLGTGFDPSIIDKGEAVSQFETPIGKIWNTFVYIVQIAAIACIVIAGIRYMFASANEKADLKKSLIPLLIGAILVYAASSVAKFVIDATTQAGIN